MWMNRRTKNKELEQNSKTTKPRKKRRECLLLTQKGVFLLSLGFCWLWNEKIEKFGFVWFLNGYDRIWSIKISKKHTHKKKNVFQHFGFGCLHWKVRRKKKEPVFSQILIDHSIWKTTIPNVFFVLSSLSKEKKKLKREREKHHLSQKQTFSQNFFGSWFCFRPF